MDLDEELAKLIRNWPDEHFRDLWEITRKYLYAYQGDDPHCMEFCRTLDERFGFPCESPLPPGGSAVE
jgi:hypothetical protein